MPQRNSSTRVMTPTVQGDDSYVVVRKLTVGEAQEVMRERQRHSKEARKALQQAGEDQALRDIFKEESQADAAYETFDWAVRRFADHILSWNWVLDDGTPMPQVKDDPSILAQLTSDEMKVISDALGSNEDAAKN